MRTFTTAVLAAVLLLGAVPAGAATQTSNIDCTDLDGRERLTMEGGTTSFEAPLTPQPILSATGELFEPVSPHRAAHWDYQADLAPVSDAQIDIALSWDDATSDYDLFVTDDEGYELARSVVENPQAGDSSESVRFDVGHCDSFTVTVTNFAGTPLQNLDLAITATPAENATTLTCAEGDTAPGCQGKAAGDTPDAVEDARSIFYLGGDVGQGSMVHTQAGAEEVPFRPALTSERSTSGTPNFYVAPPVGFNDYRNPFQAFFGAEFEEPRTISGDATAVFWVSSQTMDQGGTLFAELFADGGSMGRVEIPGAEIGARPTRIAVTFADLDVEAYDITFQLATEPVASSNGTTSDPGNATFTVWYDSVQFPSRVTLP